MQESSRIFEKMDPELKTKIFNKIEMLSKLNLLKKKTIESLSFIIKYV